MAELRETRRRPCAKVECPQCGKSVTLWQETEEWTQTRTGRWRHYAYGPGSGECCGLAFLDSEWDGLMTFRLPAEVPRG